VAFLRSIYRQKRKKRKKQKKRQRKGMNDN